MKIIAILLLNLFLVLSLDANTAEEKLRNQHLNLQKQIEIINAKTDTLSKSIADANQLIKQADNLYNESDRIFDKSISLFSINTTIIYGFATIVALLFAMAGISIFSLNKYYKNKLAQITDSNVQTIRSLVAKHHKEQVLLNNANILIINKEGTNSDKGIEMVLERFTPKSVDVKNFLNLTNTEFKNLKLSKYDAVILDNVNYENDSLNWNFNDRTINKKLINIVQKICAQNSVFLYFGDNNLDGKFRNDPKLISYLHLISFANQSATLFANLINLLDYRSLLNKDN